MPDVIKHMNTILSQYEVHDRHSFYQLKHFIVDAEPTLQAKMHACVRELRSRRLSLESMNMEIEELKDKDTLLDLEIQKITEEAPTYDDGTDINDAPRLDRFEKERSLELRSLHRKRLNVERQILELQRKMHHIAEESQFFCTAFDELIKQEPFREWDNIEVQRQYWNAKLGNELRTRLVLGQPIDTELAKAILNLHEEAPTRKQILQLLNRLQEKALMAEAAYSDQTCIADSKQSTPTRPE